MKSGRGELEPRQSGGCLDLELTQLMLLALLTFGFLPVNSIPRHVKLGVG